MANPSDSMSLGTAALRPGGHSSWVTSAVTNISSAVTRELTPTHYLRPIPQTIYILFIPSLLSLHPSLILPHPISFSLTPCLSFLHLPPPLSIQHTI